MHTQTLNLPIGTDFIRYIGKNKILQLKENVLVQ